jgi:hypothetical protein
MFIGDEVSVNVSVAVAAARLMSLIGNGSLITSSREAWREGTARVGPVGPVPGLSKLVHVLIGEPRQHGALTTLALRWEADGPSGRLFPVLDGDIILIPNGDDATLIGLEGVYRPPAGHAGEILDRTLLHRLAAATIRAFLSQIAEAIAAPAQSRAERAPDPGPLADQ